MKLRYSAVHSIVTSVATHGENKAIVHCLEPNRFTLTIFNGKMKKYTAFTEVYSSREEVMHQAEQQIQFLDTYSRN